MNILHEFTQFSFVESLIGHIYSVLKEQFSSNALAQSLLAQRPLINESKMLEEAARKEQDISRQFFLFVEEGFLMGVFSVYDCCT